MSAEDRLDELDYYALLGVAEAASEPEIRAAFRRFARNYHPDRFVGAELDKIRRATEIYRRGSEGLQVLTDPPARRLYDLALRQGVTRLTAEQRENAGRMLDRAAQKAKEAPPAPVLVHNGVARAAWERAVELSEAGDYKSAWKALRTALDIEPDNAFLQDQFAKVDSYLRRI